MAISPRIIAWYQQYKRDLPWRSTQDPYVIWLSEVILQQTRVDQGLPYFYRFLERFPTVVEFAEAGEDEILRLWQGLGYYSRARNMHAAAKEVLTTYGGIFPTHYRDLLRLKGVGTYTAAAIASFAGGEPRAVVDGNVYRVLSRYFGIQTPINSTRGQREFQQIADELLDHRHAGLHNQAMMEFGALQCKPQRPECERCPLNGDCHAYREGLVSQLPVKTKGKASRNRYFNYLLLHRSDSLLMNKRGPGDIWESLYDFPLIETNGPVEAEALALDAFQRQVGHYFGKNARISMLSGQVKHVLSHQVIHASFYQVSDVEKIIIKNRAWNFFNTGELSKLAKPKLIYSFLNRYLGESQE